MIFDVTEKAYWLITILSGSELSFASPAKLVYLQMCHSSSGTVIYILIITFVIRRQNLVVLHFQN